MSKTVDLSGQIFGRLTVLHKLNRRSGNNTMWKCHCLCGKEVEVSAGNLKSGNTKSCGCLQKEIASNNRRINLIGKRFGKLLVIDEFEHEIGDQIVFWKCRCDCGNTTIVNTDLLNNGHTKSCGHLKKEAIDKYIASEAKEGTLLVAIDKKRKINKNNKSGVKGVYWDKSRGKWSASITFKRKNIHLGRFDNKQDAIEARKRAEEKYFHPVLEKYGRDIGMSEE